MKAVTFDQQASAPELFVIDELPAEKPASWEDRWASLTPLPITPHRKQSSPTDPPRKNSRPRHTHGSLHPLERLSDVAPGLLRPISTQADLTASTGISRRIWETVSIFLMELTLSAACFLVAGLAAAAMVKDHTGPQIAWAIAGLYLLIFAQKTIHLHVATRDQIHLLAQPRFTRMLIGSLVFAAPHVIAFMILRGTSLPQ